MPYSRHTLVALIAFLIPPFAVAQAPSTPQANLPDPNAEGIRRADEILNFATAKLTSMDRVGAKVEQDLNILNQEFRLEGNYYKDTNLRIRLQLNLIGLGDSGSTMLQVCDGKILWDFQKVLGMQNYRKREITQILKKLEDPIFDASFRTSMIGNLGFGGPEGMISGLRKAIRFDQISDGKLDPSSPKYAAVAEGKTEGIDVWIVSGTWKDRTLLLGANDRPLSPTAPLPSYIPANVRLFIGKQDGWPYKTEMIGNAPSLLQTEDTRAIDPASGRPVGQPRKAPKVDPSRIFIFYKPLPASEIDPNLFVFSPPSNVSADSIKDDTDEVMLQLGQAIEYYATQKKAEAAKNEGDPLLKAADPLQAPSDAAGSLPITPTPLPK